METARGLKRSLLHSLCAGLAAALLLLHPVAVALALDLRGERGVQWQVVRRGGCRGRADGAGRVALVSAARGPSKAEALTTTKHAFLLRTTPRRLRRTSHFEPCEFARSVVVGGVRGGSRGRSQGAAFGAPRFHFAHLVRHSGGSHRAAWRAVARQHTQNNWWPHAPTTLWAASCEWQVKTF